MQGVRINRPLALARLIVRFALVSTLMVTFAVAATAYTLVFRDGRRIEVPPEFTLTKTTLTYEVAPGISKTVQLVLVDVTATERANNEAPGGFFKHAKEKLSITSSLPLPRAQRTLTNRDLEPMQQRRIESEKNYEKRRIELGLPSIEESRRRQEQEYEAMLPSIRERQLAQQRDEAYWRERASTLRREIVAVDAQINYLRSRLSEFSNFPLATHSLITSVLPLVPLETRSAVVRPRIANPGVFGTQGSGSQFGGGVGQVGMLVNPFPFHPARPLVGFGFPFGFPVNSISSVGIGRPFDYVEESYERTGLRERLNSLLVMRAGMAARWRELEDEARDARVPQVWLEP